MKMAVSAMCNLLKPHDRRMQTLPFNSGATVTTGMLCLFAC